MVREIAVGRVGASQDLKPFTWLQSHLLKTKMYNNKNNNNNNNKQQFQSISIPFFLPANVMLILQVMPTL
jgi:hypothetical protein